MLACWKGGFGRHHDVDIWNATPLCIMWNIWQKRNNCTFEGFECSPLELKLFFICSMYDWMTALSGHSFSNIMDFRTYVTLEDVCNNLSTLPMYTGCDVYILIKFQLLI